MDDFEEPKKSYISTVLNKVLSRDVEFKSFSFDDLKFNKKGNLYVSKVGHCNLNGTRAVLELVIDPYNAIDNKRYFVRVRAKSVKKLKRVSHDDTLLLGSILEELKIVDGSAQSIIDILFHSTETIRKFSL